VPIKVLVDQKPISRFLQYHYFRRRLAIGQRIARRHAVTMSRCVRVRRIIVSAAKVYTIRCIQSSLVPYFGEILQF